MTGMVELLFGVMLLSRNFARKKRKLTTGSSEISLMRGLKIIAPIKSVYVKRPTCPKKERKGYFAIIIAQTKKQTPPLRTMGFEIYDTTRVERVAVKEL
jgi:hypothetical protein